MTDTETQHPPFTFRSIALTALLPSLLFAIGEGSIIPVIPAIAGNLGASLALAGFIAGMTMIGQLAGDIPSGWLVSRIGERRSMISAALVSIAAITLCMFASNTLMLGIGIFFIGLAAAVFALARQAFMTTFVPLQYRARALSTLGGTFRAGWFVGPFLGAAIISLTGLSQSVFWIQAVCGVAIVVLMLTVPDPIEKIERAVTSRSASQARAAGSTARGSADSKTRVPDAGEAEVAAESAGLPRTIWRFKGVLARVGSGVALVGALRASRTILLPLWAVSLGLDEASTGVIVGIGGALDFALFYSSGQIMDRFGRLWSVVPSMLGMGTCLLVLAFTHDFTHAVTWFIIAAIALGISNGIGSGIVLTLGADLAPKQNPAPFLGAFRFTGDLGTAAAPVLISLIVAFGSLPLAVGVLGALGYLGAGILFRSVPKYVPHAVAAKPLSNAASV